MSNLRCRAVLKYLAYILFPPALMAVIYYGGGAIVAALS